MGNQGNQGVRFLDFEQDKTAKHENTIGELIIKFLALPINEPDPLIPMAF